jgi:glycosyltransferase involved in cell wall biosynthesis
MSKALAHRGAEIDFVVPYEAEHPGIDFMNVHAATDLPPLQKNGLGAYDGTCYVCEDPEECVHQNLKDLRSVQERYKKFVERVVKDTNPQVIHAHDWLTMEAGVRAKQISGAPLIVHVHATEYDRSGEHFGNPIIHDIEAMALAMADRVIAVSQLTKDIIVREYHIPEDKVEVVYNGLDAEAYEKHIYDVGTFAYLESLRREGYTIVGTVARLTVQKGVGYFIKAAARASEKHDQLLFLIAGDGEMHDELIELSATLGIADRVFFTGFIRGQQWRDAYSVVDVFVMSSVSEPFGLTALEAAHHDSALLISRQSGVGEVLSSVLRFNYWDIDRLADEIVGIAASPALAHELRSNVAREYTKVSWKDVASSCLQLYRKVATETGGASA